MIVTFVDAGVLIAAAHGNSAVSYCATSLLGDAERAFASSIFVQLEVIPKAIFNRRNVESEAYRTFFAAVRHWANPAEICPLALEVASESGLSALDALHVPAAVVAKADEFVTTELPSKPLYRTRRVKVVSLSDIPISRKPLS